LDENGTLIGKVISQDIGVGFWGLDECILGIYVNPAKMNDSFGM